MRKASRLRGKFSFFNGGWLLFLVLASYFLSDSLLREAAAKGAIDKGLRVSDVVSKLPEGVRDTVERQIDLAATRDALATAKTDRDKINALLCLGVIQGRKEFEEANAKILDEFPDSPEARSAYSFFLLAREGAPRSVSPERYRSYVTRRLPEISRVEMWRLALRRFEEVEYPPEKVFDFFAPVFERPPIYREYEVFFMELAEFAFRNDSRYWEGEAKRLEDACSKGPSLSDIPGGPPEKAATGP